MTIMHRAAQITSATLTLLVLGVSAAALLALSQGSKFLSVQSGSMVPTLHKGDLVAVHRVPDQAYAVGDIITFISPVDKNVTYTHRIKQIIPPTAMLPTQYVTQGDANPAADRPIQQAAVIGKVTFYVPYIGYGFDFVRQPLGLILAIYVPALTIIGAEVRRLARYYKDREPYVVAGFDPAHKTVPEAAGSGGNGATQAHSYSKAGAVAVIAVASIAAPTVHAALFSSATLGGTTIATTQQAITYPLISRVVFATNSGSTTNTNLSVTNNSSQSGTSGNASGAGATSGNVSNTSNQNTSFTITTGGGGSASQPTILLTNPTTTPISLQGYSLRSQTTTYTFPSGSVLPASGSKTVVMPAAFTLAKYGGYIQLIRPDSSVVDALSWGSDTTMLNPAIRTSNTTMSLYRTDPNIDTNSATDWSVN